MASTPAVAHVATVTTTDATLERVARYLPSNFKAFQEQQLDGTLGPVRITGVDVSGWTIQSVIDRLASGCIFVQVDA